MPCGGRRMDNADVRGWNHNRLVTSLWRSAGSETKRFELQIAQRGPWNWTMLRVFVGLAKTSRNLQKNLRLLVNEAFIYQRLRAHCEKQEQSILLKLMVSRLSTESFRSIYFPNPVIRTSAENSTVGSAVFPMRRNKLCIPTRIPLGHFGLDWKPGLYETSSSKLPILQCNWRLT